MKDIINQIRSYVDLHQLIDPKEKVLVSFSAGPDSVMVYEFLKQHMANLNNIFLIYFNHGLRPDDNEQAVIKAIEEKDRIKIHQEQLPVKQHSLQNKMSIEHAGRDLRYSSLEQFSLNKHIATVITAHHLDDHIETFFMQLLRGAKSRLHGISPKRILHHPVSIVRPLLSVTKPQILQYLDSEASPYAIDPSNADPKLYQRNKVRHELIPTIESINPSYRHTLKSFMASLTPPILFIIQDIFVDEKYGSNNNPVLLIINSS